MAQKVFCDRCGDAILPGDRSFSGKLPAMDDKEHRLKIDGKESIMASHIGTDHRDLCNLCILAFIAWWDEGEK